MNSYPTVQLHITEPASGPAPSIWPAAQSFPRYHHEAIFSLPALRYPTHKPILWLITLDINKLAEQLNVTVH